MTGVHIKAGQTQRYQPALLCVLLIMFLEMYTKPILRGTQGTNRETLTSRVFDGLRDAFERGRLHKPDDFSVGKSGIFMAALQRYFVNV
ncbi:hypothetical protein NDU88_004288 [Pleurodeles waltl]|uniref:Uncharacterized protein n=1 Tax=Pleurodeles waltl TaxID=8319 RepID=A0AAV7RHQ0_PLEWA|nr:hypothetical protein NDU88_004288 [Pleurodeles waltl]